MEDFFKFVSDLNFKPTPEEGAKISLDYGMKVVGPPLQSRYLENSNNFSFNN